MLFGCCFCSYRVQQSGGDGNKTSVHDTPWYITMILGCMLWFFPQHYLKKNV